MSKVWSVSRVGLLAGAGALVLLAWWSWPYIQHPVLLQNEVAISSSLGDATGAALLRSATNSHIFDLDYPARKIDYQGTRTLCSAGDIRSGTASTGSCDLSKIVRAGDCENRGFCAAMRFDPTVVADPALRSALLQALQTPCRSLPLDKASDPPRLVGPMAFALVTDRRLLKCGRWNEVHGRIATSAEQPTVFRVRF